jgi:oligopeptide transport system substrate-binding protein
MPIRHVLALIGLSVALGAHVALAATLNLGNPGEPETLDPSRYNLRLEETILNDLFLGLTTFDAQAHTTPGAAESWTTSADGLEWTFKLRPNLAWSDGAPLTAEDFVYSFRRLLDPKTAASLAHFMYPLKNAEAINSGRAPLESLGARAVDTRTLVLTLEAPFPFLTERLMYPTGFPVPRHVIERVGDDWVKAGNMVSNGAFTLAEWRPQAYVKLVKNPHFYDASNVALAGVTYYPAADANAAYNRYRAGELQSVGGFPSGELPWAREHLADQLRLSPLLSIVYLVFNVERPPFQDLRVRQALALVIEREVLTDKVLRTGELPSYSFVPAMVADYQPAPVPEKGQPAGARIARAKELLTQAGYGPDHPLSLTLRYISGADTKKVHVAIAAMWKAIGVNARLHQAELKVHFADLRQGNFEVAQAGWFGENNPEHYLRLLASDTGNVNYGRFRDAALDELLHEAGTVADRGARVRVLHDAEARALPLYPVVPLYSVMIRNLVDPRITGWKENPRDVHPARFLGLRAH